MDLLFIYYSERVYEDEYGNLYAGGNFPQEVWDRYLNISDSLSVIMRKAGKRVRKTQALQSLERIDTDRIHMILLPDLYAGLHGFFNLHNRNRIKVLTNRQISRCDAVIIREAHSPLMRMVRISGVPYLTEVIGSPWDICWNHGLKGRILALPEYLKARYGIAQSQWVLYVTKRYLQKKYPSFGHQAAVCDAAVPDVSEEILKKRLKKIDLQKKTLVIGTAAALDVSYKGQKYVIQALAELKKQGIRYEYQLAGAGSGRKLLKEAKKHGVEKQVKILGQITHGQILEWLETIDIYINPSLTEGLPRAVVEAMSYGLPCFASDAGGHPELLERRALFKAGSVPQIVRRLRSMTSSQMKKMAVRNFRKAEDYKKEKLDRKRNLFFRQFLRAVQNR